MRVFQVLCALALVAVATADIAPLPEPMLMSIMNMDSLSVEEQELWVATFELCPRWGEWAEEVCPDGPESCSRDFTALEQSVICAEFRGFACYSSEVAQGYLAETCSTVATTVGRILAPARVIAPAVTSVFANPFGTYSPGIYSPWGTGGGYGVYTGLYNYAPVGGYGFGGFGGNSNMADNAAASWGLANGPTGIFNNPASMYQATSGWGWGGNWGVGGWGGWGNNWGRWVPRRDDDMDGRGGRTDPVGSGTVGGGRTMGGRNNPFGTGPGRYSGNRR